VCVAQAAKAVGKDLALSDVTKAIIESVDTGSLSPLKDLLSAGTAVTVAQDSADYVAAHRAIQTATRGFLRSQGVRVSANAIGKRAALFGKFAGVIGAGLTAMSGYDAYNARMSN
jgi:hypothetical protein